MKQWLSSLAGKNKANQTVNNCQKNKVDKRKFLC